MVKILSCSGVSAFGAVADMIFSGTLAAVIVVLLDWVVVVVVAALGVDTDLGVLATLVADFLAFLVVDDDELDTGLELLVYLVSFSIVAVGVVLVLV